MEERVTYETQPESPRCGTPDSRAAADAVRRGHDGVVDRSYLHFVGANFLSHPDTTADETEDQIK